MGKIFYWQQALISKKLDAFQAVIKGVIDQLMQGNYASASLEKLKAGDKKLYSARINGKARVIFSSITHEGQSALLVLDVLENHEYNDCRFLENQYLKRFLGDLSAEDVEEIAVEHLDFAGTAVAESDFAPVHFFQGEMISLTLEQERSLSISLPALIEGEAGSGKTCVGLCALSEKINADSDARVLYLAPSTALVSQMQDNWQSLNGSSRAEFKSYDQLFAVERIADEVLAKWIAVEMKLKPLEADNILKEFSMLMTVDTLETYSALGVRQSMFPDSKQREKIWVLLERFKRQFNFNHHYHPWFSRLAESNIYDLIYVDESQSLTAYQLCQMMSYAKERAMLAGFDRHQRLMGDRYGITRFSALCHQQGINLSEQQLIGSFRCPSKVIQVVNNILNMKYALARGLPEKGAIYQYESKQTEAGQVLYCLESRDGKIYQSLLTPDHRNWAIVTSADKKQEARDKFNHPLIFTPEEILGLGYPIIVCYHLTQQATVSQISQDLLKNQSDRKYTHGASLELKEEILTCFNQWVIAASRSSNTLIILEKDKQTEHKACAFINRLFEDVSTAHAAEPLAPLESDKNWEQEITLLMAQGLTEQAVFAYEKYMQVKTKLTWQDWSAQLTLGLTPVLSIAAESFPEKTSAEDGLSVAKPAEGAAAEVSTQSRQHQKHPKKHHQKTTVASLPTFKHKYEGCLYHLECFMKMTTAQEDYYFKYINEYFKMPWVTWNGWIREQGGLTIIKNMLTKYLQITKDINRGSSARLFQPSENLGHFFQFRLGPDAPVFFEDFFNQKSIAHLISDLRSKAAIIDCGYLEFLIAFVADKPINAYEFNKYFGLLIIKLLEKKYQKKPIYEDIKRLQVCLKTFFRRSVEITSERAMILYASTVYDYPDLISAEYLLTDISPTMFLSSSAGMCFIDALIDKKAISLNFLSKWLLTSTQRPSILQCYFAVNEPLTANWQQPSFPIEKMLAFKQTIIQHAIIRQLIINDTACFFMAMLADHEQDLWLGLGTQENLTLFVDPSGNKHCSFLLKLLLDMQKAKSHKDIGVFRMMKSGKPALYEQFSDLEWYLPLMIKKEPAWMMSPLFLMMQNLHCHEFLLELLTARSKLASTLKWIFQRTLAADLARLRLSSSDLSAAPLGQRILKCLRAAPMLTPELDIDDIQARALKSPSSSSFFS